MPITFACPGCSASLTVSDAAAGRTGKCPHCRSPLTVPAVTAAVPVAVPQAVMPAAALPAAPVLAEVVPQGASALAVPDFRLRRSRMWVYAGAAGALLLVLIFLGVVLLSGRSDPPALRYLPDNFQVYLTGRYEGLTNAPAYKELDKFSKEFAKMAPQFGQQNDSELMEKMGIKNENIRRMTGGMTLGNADAPLPDMVLVVETAQPLNPDEVKNNLKKLNYAESTVGPHKVYLGNQGLMSVSFCLIDPKTVLMGVNNSLGDVLKRDRAAKISGNMRAVMQRCNGGGKPFAAGISIQDILAKPEFRQGIQAMGDQGAKIINDLDTAILEMDIGNDLEMSIVLTCKSKKTAEELTKMANGGLSMVKLTLPPDLPKEFGDLFDAVKLNQSGYDMVGSLKLKPSLLSSLFKEMLKDPRFNR